MCKKSANYLDKHSTDILFRKYYSVFRKSSYVANNSQLKTLPMKKRIEIQSKCRKVMELLEYDL